MASITSWQIQFSSAQSRLTLCDPVDCSTPSFLVHHQLPWLAQTHVHRVGDAIQPSHPLSSPSPPAFNLSQHQGLFNESTLHIRWPKYWSCRFSISPSNEYSGLISFRMDWLDLFAVQGTLKSLLQHHSSKASILQCSDFFIVQLSHPQKGEKWKQWEIVFSWAPKALLMVSAATKLKDAYSLERKAMTNLDSVLKSRDITLPTKTHIVKAMVLPVVMYACECWTIKKAEHQRIDAFELWC